MRLKNGFTRRFHHIFGNILQNTGGFYLKIQKHPQNRNFGGVNNGGGGSRTRVLTLDAQTSTGLAGY